MNGDGNFKMKCIGTGNISYTRNKLYEVVNGHWVDDDGDSMGSDKIKTIVDVNKWSCGVWELVEDETTEPVKNELSVSERMRKVANMLGLELDEEFNIVREGKPLNYGPYNFTERGLLDKDGCRLDKKMAELIRGIYTVEKLLWKPKDGERVWYIFNSEHTEESWCERFAFDSKNTSRVALYKSGWMFRTKKEAEANMERVLTEMKEVMENE